MNVTPPQRKCYCNEGKWCTSETVRCTPLFAMSSLLCADNSAWNSKDKRENYRICAVRIVQSERRKCAHYEEQCNGVCAYNFGVQRIPPNNYRNEKAEVTRSDRTQRMIWSAVNCAQTAVMSPKIVRWLWETALLENKHMKYALIFTNIFKTMELIPLVFASLMMLEMQSNQM